MSQIIATTAVLVAYALGAALDEHPSTMFVGLSPLALLTAETAWHLIGDLIEERT